jgi:hypothetical protein
VLALVTVRQLEDLAELPLSEIARIAPSLCDAVLRAVRSDAALTHARTASGDGPVEADAQAAEGELRLMWEAAPREAVRAVEALRAVLWDALVHAAGAMSLGQPSGHLLRDVADRLAYVCSVVLERSLPAPASARTRPPQASQRSESVPRPQTPPWVALRAAGGPAARRAPRHEQHAPQRPDAHRGEQPAPRPPATPRRAVLVDEFVEARVRARPAADAGAARAEDSGGPAGVRSRTPARADGRALPWDIPLRGGGVSGPASGDTRGARAPADRATAPSISISRRRPPREHE